MVLQLDYDLVNIDHNLVAKKKGKGIENVKLKVEPLYYPEARKSEGLILTLLPVDFLEKISLFNMIRFNLFGYQLQEGLLIGSRF